MSKHRLPIVDDHVPGEGSLGRDGQRRVPYPADVSGRWTRARFWARIALIAIWIALPLVPIGGHPAVLFDVARKQFFLFGATFNAQDVPLTFFAVTGLGFALVFVTALFGRAWCGWACPQTVFIESLFRPIERFLHGPRNVAQRRRNGPWTWDRLWREALMHACYIFAALFTAHVFLAYFVALPELYRMVLSAPTEHGEAFAWMLGTTALFYVDFGIFREQFCVAICPYGRMQSILLDDDSLVVGYDERRGEPRGPGKEKRDGQGDCVDCRRCVVVCPTGIDIREGLQLDCIACTACIDACDEVMDKLGRPRGLVRYDSLRGLQGGPRKILRPRIFAYVALLVCGALVATFVFRSRTTFEANLLRLPGAPYTRDAASLRNGFELHLVNKKAEKVVFDIAPEAPPDMAFLLPMQHVELGPLESRRVPFFVTMSISDFREDRAFDLRVTAGASKVVHARFLGAR